MLKRLSALLPYLAVIVGLFGLRSAWAALWLYHAGMFASVVAWKREKPADRKGRLGVVGILAAAAVFACGGFALYILWPYLNPRGRMIPARLAEYGVVRANWIYLAIYFSCANSVLEELFWRGCLRSDRRRWETNDFLFGGYHALVLMPFAGPLWMIPTLAVCAFAGWLWRRLRAATNGLTVPILTHMVADVSIVIAVHFRVYA